MDTKLIHMYETLIIKHKYKSEMRFDSSTFSFYFTYSLNLHLSVISK